MIRLRRQLSSITHRSVVILSEDDKYIALSSSRTSLLDHVLALYAGAKRTLTT